MNKNKLTPQEIFQKAISGQSISPEEREVLRRTLSTPSVPEGLTGNEKLKDKSQNKARMGTKLNSSLGGYVPNIKVQQFGGNTNRSADSTLNYQYTNYDEFASGGWIQKATKNMRKDKPCTGSKFGSSTCPPGSRRYNLAKTFRKMARNRQDGGSVIEDVDDKVIKENDSVYQMLKGGYLTPKKTGNGKQPEIPTKKKIIPRSKLMKNGGKVITADSVVKYENGSEEYNNKGYIPNAQTGDYINGGREDNWVMPTKLFMANKHKNGGKVISADDVIDYDVITREYNNYQTGGKIEVKFRNQQEAKYPFIEGQSEFGNDLFNIVNKMEQDSESYRNQFNINQPEQYTVYDSYDYLPEGMNDELLFQKLDNISSDYNKKGAINPYLKKDYNRKIRSLEKDVDDYYSKIKKQPGGYLDNTGIPTAFEDNYRQYKKMYPMTKDNESTYDQDFFKFDTEIKEADVISRQDPRSMMDKERIEEHVNTDKYADTPADYNEKMYQKYLDHPQFRQSINYTNPSISQKGKDRLFLNKVNSSLQDSPQENIQNEMVNPFWRKYYGLDNRAKMGGSICKKCGGHMQTGGKMCGCNHKQKGGFISKLDKDAEFVFRNWRDSMPENLQSDNESYDLRGAWLSNQGPAYVQDDMSFHLFSTDPTTGKHLKSPNHPTRDAAIEMDIRNGYTPYLDVKSGNWYTKKSDTSLIKKQHGGEFKMSYPKVDNTRSYVPIKNDVVEPTQQMIELERKRKVPFNHSLGWNVLELVEPTGVASYPDVYEAWNDGKLDYNDFVEPLGALPGIGYFGRMGKLGMKGDKLGAGSLLKVPVTANWYDTGSDIYQDNIKKKQNGGSTEFEKQGYQDWVNAVQKKKYLDWKLKNAPRDKQGNAIVSDELAEEMSNHPLMNKSYTESFNKAVDKGLVDYLSNNVPNTADKNIYDEAELWDVSNPEVFKKYKSYFKKKGGNLPCHKCGGSHKSYQMCYGGNVEEFKVIDEQDILPLNDSNRFATKERKKPVGFIYSKSITR